MTATAGRNGQLDGLRGYAALIVVIYHMIIALDESQMERIYYADFIVLPDAYSILSKTILRIFNGQAAVFLFFVLSGAVLFQSLARDHAGIPRLAWTFALRRLIRIYPAVIVCVAFIAATLFAIGHPTTISTAIRNMLLLEWNLNVPMWTLAVEVTAVPFMFIAFVGYRLGGLPGFLAAIAALEILSRWIGVIPELGQIQQYWLHFAMGMLVPTAIGQWLASRMPRASWMIFLALILVFKSTIQTIAIWLLIASIYHHHAGRLGEALGAKLSLFFGRISFGVYLYHYIFVTLASSYMREYSLSTGRPIEIGLLLSVPVLVVTVLVAFISTVLIEEPAIRLGRRWLGTPAKSPVKTALA